MISGKRVRIERIMDRGDGRTIIVPMDHGLAAGPIEGITNMADAVDKVVLGGANAVLMHKGSVSQAHRGHGKDVGLIVHLNGSTSLSPDPNEKVMVASVEQAIKLGADAVSVHINVGAKTEADMLSDLGMVAESCDEWGMPLLAMMYPRGPGIKDPFSLEVVSHAARVGAELGADIVKTNYTGDIATFEKVVEGVGIPVLIAGGEKAKNETEVLKTVKDSVEAGGSGVAMGRNIFQAGNPTNMVKALDAVIHGNKSIEEARKLLG